MTLVSAIEKVNRGQKRLLPIMLRKRFGEAMDGLRIAVLGLAFKPGTDDMREAPSITLINDLMEHGAEISAFDPIAVENARAVLPKETAYAQSPTDALHGADAAVLVTEWPEFESIDWKTAASSMKQKILFDGRNFYDPAKLESIGFEYYCVGRNKTPAR
jgi:UDPglucose 6-dehydrogenase